MSFENSNVASELIRRIAAKDARVGIIGLGYVGIPLALRFQEVGLNVLGFDIDDERVRMLNAGQSPIKHIPAESIAAMTAGGFEATSEFQRVVEVDAIIICVPTPLTQNREPDLSFVVATMRSIDPYLRAGQVLSLESTTWPGTTEEILRPYVDNRDLVVGTDFFLIYSPEREDPGNEHFTTRNIPKVVGGTTATCLKVGTALYQEVIDRIVPVSSTKAAELTKLLENIHRSVNIGLVNEMKLISDRMNIDIYEVIDAAATKPFGFTPYYPGPGLGGHCIPIDPFYLTWKAREYGVTTHFIELAGEINRNMPKWVVTKVAEGLNESHKALKGSLILALGIAYKRDIEDCRESPSVEVMELLQQHGAIVHYSDPFAPEFPRMREHHFDLQSVDLTPDALANYDAVVLLTDHTDFNYDMIIEHSKIVVDTRGKFRDKYLNVVKA